MAKPLQKIMQYVGQHGIVRPRDIEAIGLPREYLVRLHRQGKLNRPGRGIYTLPDANVTERHSYAEVAKRVPESVICLLTMGIENHQVDGVPVRVYSAAKTVADCFKFRNKIGLDIAIEALKDCLRQKRASINEIYRYAQVCRVSNVIRPYMEAL
jgi:predicted transcriptional regulator of viral defense system